MRVCVLTATDAWGGAEIHTLTVARTLAARGHEVSIYQLGHRLYESARPEGDPGLRIVPVGLAKRVLEVGLVEWLRLFRSFGGGLCLFPKGLFEVGSWQLDLAARVSFSRFVTVEHTACPPMPPKSSRRHFGGIVPGAAVWWYRLLMTRRLRAIGPHRVICVSDAVRRQLASYYRFPLRKMSTVHNGISSERFRPCPEARRARRREWAIPDDALLLGAVGRLWAQKGYDVAVDAFRELVSGMPGRDLRLLLVGEGPLRAELQERARGVGIHDRFLLLDFTDRPWEIYAALDIFLMPSRNEGLPLALLEAMACGACPIAMAVAGIPEVLTDPALGWLVPAGDRQAFVEAMRQAVRASQEARAEMGRRARAHVVAHFNADVQFSLIADLIEREWAQVA